VEFGLIAGGHTLHYYENVQCYLLSDRGDTPVFIHSQLRLILDFSTLEGCKAVLT